MGNSQWEIVNEKQLMVNAKQFPSKLLKGKSKIVDWDC